MVTTRSLRRTWWESDQVAPAPVRRASPALELPRGDPPPAAGVRHNPRVPSTDRFPHARRQRRVLVRPLLLGVAAGLAVLLAIPLATGIVDAPPPMPVGQVVSGQEPTPRGSQAPATLPQVASSHAPVPTGPVTTLVPADSATDAIATPAETAAETAGLTAGETAAETAETAAETAAVPGVVTVQPERGVVWPVTRAPALDSLEGYRWPLAHPRLTLPFGPSPWGSRLVDGESFHDGVDLATFCNDKILAAHSGTVLAAGRHYDDAMGWIGDLQPYYNRLDRKNIWSQLPIVVVIDDGNGYRSMYAHMWKLSVKKGDVVKAGQVIGREGMTGRASGCHLHYGLFSPLETATFRIRPDVVKRMKVPKEQIARVDPLLVLPPRAGINAPAKPKASAEPKASAAPKASAVPKAPAASIVP